MSSTSGRRWSADGSIVGRTQNRPSSRRRCADPLSCRDAQLAELDERPALRGKVNSAIAAVRVAIVGDEASYQSALSRSLVESRDVRVAVRK
jgi:hypothetical protein